MSIELTSQNIKSFAKNLRTVLAEHHLSLKHSQSLEILSRTFGYKDWNTFSALLKQSDSGRIPESSEEKTGSGLPAESLSKELAEKGNEILFVAAVTTMEFIPISAGTIRLSEDYTAEITNDFHLCDHPTTCREFNPYLIDRGRKPHPRHMDDLPVVDVNWKNVQDFIEWLNSFSESYLFRLPTEAEWEYACRAGNPEADPFDDSEADIYKYAWYLKNSGGNLQPVKRLLPNPWELYDMQGSVSEWVQDYYADYPQGTFKDPVGPDAGVDRVLRGGAFTYGDHQIGLKKSFISYKKPSFRDSSSPLGNRNFIGFRLVRQQRKFS